MPIRFWRRFKIFPGVWLNISKSGISFSFGTRGAKYTAGMTGSRATVGIPGSGLSYTKFLGRKKKKRAERNTQQASISDYEVQKILDEVNGDK